jgi:hypothetical protein
MIRILHGVAERKKQKREKDFASEDTEDTEKKIM